MMRSPGTESATLTRARLEAMTKAQLLDIASGRGLRGLDGRSLKADMINAILGVPS